MGIISAGGTGGGGRSIAPLACDAALVLLACRSVRVPVVYRGPPAADIAVELRRVSYLPHDAIVGLAPCLLLEAVAPAAAG